MPEALLRPPQGVATTRPLATGATRLILIRHGEADANGNGIIGGRKGCTGLTASGKDQIQRLALQWRELVGDPAVTALCTSPLERAAESADLLVGALGLDHIDVVDSLVELEPGSADGMTWTSYLGARDIPDWDLDPTTPFATGGESWTSFFDRVRAALDELRCTYPAQRIAAVTHAGFIEAAISLVTSGAVILPRMQLPTKHASLTEFEHGERGWRLVSYNVVAVD